MEDRKPNNRGFRGGDGQRSRKPRAPSEYNEKLLDLRRVTRVVAGGKRLSFRATMVVGNEKGKVGIGVGKGLDAPASIMKAKNNAMKNILKVPIINNTV